MPINRRYDTVAFDVRENATMLFFARTTPGGDIEDYLLLMRASGNDEDESLYLEINERQFGGSDLIKEARLTGNVLTLELSGPLEALQGVTQIVLTYENTAANKASIEAGAFRVLGNTLCGGNA